ncbi:dienelactone hydrolase family protein [Brevifollis gellanilyticus]|uniref:KANL3/Tex30 alpha/beta hydrolase-like domain-containing protein n=1 Tax=Brevifollis gellanilyticus TaxID=748831 RepID=A0A512MGD1_9BACT|nr:alpha/beta family hydrolase [Brevifollis gellanilyticus]GEP45766.1 hypothetical protein BGE01nite_50570 [Brevifollis gellanilyticus]
MSSEICICCRHGKFIQATLRLPDDPVGLVIFAYGSGSSRISPRNRYVAEVLHEASLATLLIDLLTEEEEEDHSSSRQHRFDIPLLADRLEDACTWADCQPQLAALPLGFFGSSTGSAVAVQVAAQQADRIAAVVSRGGRPDLAGDESLAEVMSPTLLIVGEKDEGGTRLNEQARAEMRCETELRIIPGASHLFSEPGALELVAEAASQWFVEHMESVPALA